MGEKPLVTFFDREEFFLYESNIFEWDSILGMKMNPIPFYCCYGDSTYPTASSLFDLTGRPS